MSEHFGSAPASSVFESLNSVKTSGGAAENVVEKLRTMIEWGEMAAGDRLPPERDLAKSLGVSRPTLRAGIRSLSAVGLLRSRQGAGTFVGESVGLPTLDGSPSRFLTAIKGLTSDELREALMSLEVIVVRLAAKNATREDIATLAEEIDGIRSSLNDPEKYIRHDINFHQAIALASGNRVLAALLVLIAETGNERRRKTIKRAKDLTGALKSYQSIYRAISEQDPDAAERAMHAHLM